MSRNTGNRSAAPRSSGSSLFTGILIGMVIGAGMAAGLAWYLMKSPSPFMQKEQPAARLPMAVEKLDIPVVLPAGAASGVGEGKPRFEFYKVLTDKQDAAIATPARPSGMQQPDKPIAADSRPPVAGEANFLQAGSFSRADDAEKLKARLALLGLEAHVQVATIPDRGVWHRVRLGPYKNAEELSNVRALLKQNNMDATPTRAQ